MPRLRKLLKWFIIGEILLLVLVGLGIWFYWPKIDTKPPTPTPAPVRSTVSKKAVVKVAPVQAPPAQPTPSTQAPSGTQIKVNVSTPAGTRVKVDVDEGPPVVVSMPITPAPPPATVPAPAPAPAPSPSIYPQPIPPPPTPVQMRTASSPPLFGLEINIFANGGWYGYGNYGYGWPVQGAWRPGYMAWVCEDRPSGRVCFEKWIP